MALPADIFPQVMRALDLIGQGRTKTSACDEAGITTATFDNYVRSTPELHAIADNAEQRGFDTLAEILLEIDRHEHYGSADPKQQKVISDNIKWYLSRKRPQQYGDKVTVDVNITADKAITDALSRAKDRAEGRILEDVSYTRVEDQRENAATLDVTALDPELLQFV